MLLLKNVQGGVIMSGRNSIMSILYGVCTILIIVLGTSLLLSLLLRFTSLQESSITWIVLVISMFALFFGGLIAGGKGQEKGWLIGGATGLIFTLIVFLVQYLGYQTNFTLKQTLFHVAYILVAIIGGIIGVNLSGKKRAA